jgi:hypothetical protein
MLLPHAPAQHSTAPTDPSMGPVPFPPPCPWANTHHFLSVSPFTHIQPHRSNLVSRHLHPPLGSLGLRVTVHGAAAERPLKGRITTLLVNAIQAPSLAKDAVREGCSRGFCGSKDGMPRGCVNEAYVSSASVSACLHLLKRLLLKIDP